MPNRCSLSVPFDAEWRAHFLKDENIAPLLSEMAMIWEAKHAAVTSAELVPLRNPLARYVGWLCYLGVPPLRVPEMPSGARVELANCGCIIAGIRSQLTEPVRDVDLARVAEVTRRLADAGLLPSG